MRPRSLQHRPTDTWWPSLKRAEHDLILSTRARARWACIEVESRQTPKNVSDSDSVRIHTSVWPKPPSLWQGSPDSSKQHLEGFCATAGTFLPPTKGSNRGKGVPESDMKQGFFSRYFLLPKKDEGLWPILDPEFPAPLGIDAFAHPWPTVRLYAFPSSQANSSSPVQGEGERCPSPTRSPVLAIPDMVLRADSSSVSAPSGDSDQARPSLSASGQDLVSSAWYLEAVGMAHPGSLTLISSLPA